MRYVYKMIGGMASDIRYVEDSYTLRAGEYDEQGDKLPSPEELNHEDILKEVKKIEVKKIAGVKIIALAGPDWKQRNVLARYLELLSEKADGGTLSASETTELNSMKALWARIKAIRTASNNIEEAINGLSTREEILNYNIDNSPLWP